MESSALYEFSSFSSSYSNFEDDVERPFDPIGREVEGGVWDVDGTEEGDPWIPHIDWLLLNMTAMEGNGGFGGAFNGNLYNLNVTVSDTDLYRVPTGIVVLLSLFYGSISLIAVIGNALVMWIVATSRKMHSVTNYFIANLALADIIIALFAIPFQTVSVNVSIFTLTAISVDRYRAIMYPLNARPSKFRSKIVIISIWLFSTALAVPNAIALRVTFVYDQVTGGTKPFCNAVGIDPAIMWAYSHVLVGLQYFLPLGIISFAYIRMGWELMGARTPGNAEDTRDALVLRNKKKVIKMLFMVVALFAFCWAPLQAYHVLKEIYPVINTYRYINIIWFCTHWLAMSNSCCNPFIYAIYNEKFKREFRNKFRCCFKEDPGPDISDIDRWRCQASFRYTGEQRIYTNDRQVSRSTETTQLNGSTRSSPRSVHSTGLIRSSSRTSTKAPGVLGNGGGGVGVGLGPHAHQEVHVCVPLKSYSHLHPEMCNIRYDTKM
ncbi:substance-K receptor-like isoform X2 [Oratosquilla oratoria]|uniref:substance-K receptor-like isoform X2 n=1 Tax=Oratosquilla oratoria TaxID=337810 RepID=UPI003F76BC3A